MKLELLFAGIDWSLFVNHAGVLVVSVVAVLAVVGAGICWQETRQRRDEESGVAAVVPMSAQQLFNVGRSTDHVQIGALIDFVFEGESDVATTSRAALASRAHLNEELAEMLVSANRIKALKYLWLHVPHCPDSLAVALRECIVTLPAWMQERYPKSGPTRTTEFEWACRAIPRLVERLKRAGMDFRQPIAQLAEYIRQREGPEAEHFLVMLEGVSATESTRKPRLGMMLWENCRGLSKSPMSPISPETPGPARGARSLGANINPNAFAL